MALTDKLTAIANAIRTKTGSTDSLTLDQMASEIDNIQSGATEPYIEEVYGMFGDLIDVNMHGYTKIRNSAFYDCSKLALTSLPAELTIIGNSAFYGCSNLALTSLPAGLTSIEAVAFKNCTGLSSITFEGTPTSIHSSSFEGCTNLTTINVPWSEGEVANAPWGATNATINYNYTGE
jgi:hypothetical protein